MINDLKLGIKLLKYSAQLKTSILMAVLFFLFGVLSTIFLDSPVSYGGLLIMVNAIWPVQLLYSINASTQVQSSSSKKKLQTSVPAMIYTGCELILYTIFIVLHLVLSHFHPEHTELLVNTILFTGIAAFLLALYTGTAYKYFFLSIALFFITYLVFTMFGNYFTYNEFNIPLSLPVTILIGYVLVILGGLLQYLLYLLFYKHNLSKYAQCNTMRKCM